MGVAAVEVKRAYAIRPYEKEFFMKMVLSVLTAMSIAILCLTENVWAKQIFLEQRWNDDEQRHLYYDVEKNVPYSGKAVANSCPPDDYDDYCVEIFNSGYSGNSINGEFVLANMVNGRLSGEWKKFYANGKMRMIGNFISTPNGEFWNGEWKEFYESGKLKSVSNFKENSLIGEWKEFYESGKPKSVRGFKDSRPNGKWKEFYENGNTKSVVSYKEGVQVGNFEEYYESGKLKRLVETDGNMAKSTYYNNNGDVVRIINRIGSIDQGGGNAKVSVYDGNGNLIEEEKFEHEMMYVYDLYNNFMHKIQKEIAGLLQ